MATKTGDTYLKNFKGFLTYAAVSCMIWILSAPFIDFKILALAISMLTAYPMVLSLNKHFDSRKLASSREELRSLIEHIYGSVGSGKTISEAITSSLRGAAILFGTRSKAVNAVESFSRSGNIGVPLSERLKLLSVHYKCPESAMIFDMLASAEIIGTDIVTILKQELTLLTDTITSAKAISSEFSQKKSEALIMSAMPFFIAWNLQLSFPAYFIDVQNDPTGRLCFTVIFIICILTLCLCLYLTGNTGISYAPGKLKKRRPPLVFLSDILLNSSSVPADRCRSIMRSLFDKLPYGFRLSLLKDLECVYPDRSAHDTDYLVVKIVVILLSLIMMLVFILSGTSIPAWGLISVSCFIAHDLEIRRRSEEIRRTRAIEFPGFLGILESFIICGSSVPSAISQCAGIFTKNRSLLADDISGLASGIMSGKPVAYALEQFALKMNVSEISAALLLIARYHSSGNTDTLSLLSLHKSSCYDLARSSARKHADSAALKLMIPMMLQFISVALISVIPSLLSSGIL